MNEFEYLISPEELALIEAMEAEAYSQKPANKIVRSTTSPIYTRISPITSRSFSQYASNKPVQPINRDSAAINSNQAVFNNSDRHYSMQRTHSAVAEACITSTPSRSPYKNYLYTQTGSQPLLTQTACGTATSNKLFSPVLLNQSTKRGVESFVPCMRLTALSIDDDEFCFLKIVKARQVNGINFSKKKAQLDANSSSSSINNYLTSDATELTVILSQEW